MVGPLPGYCLVRVEHLLLGSVPQAGTSSGVGTTLNAQLFTGEQGNILTLGYGYATGLNNGNVQTQTIGSMTAGCQSASLTQTYTCDSLNRLTGVAETGGANPWREAYAYDQWGKRDAGPGADERAGAGLHALVRGAD